MLEQPEVLAVEVVVLGQPEVLAARIKDIRAELEALAV
jgi:hypothetical protein